MKKLLKSKKALSPVIAAIILIAVTVAVSIAVAAWMGSLSMGFMETKELTISELEFDDSPSAINATITNTGTSAVTVVRVRVNSENIDITDYTFEVDAGIEELSIPYANWQAGSKYSVSLFASDGTLVGSYTDTAPA